MAKVEVRRSKRDPSHFVQFSHNITSQHGEDGILQEIFSLIGLADIPVCIDVGAWDGKHLSNTYSLFHKERNANNVTTECRPNWSGILFEADSSRFQELQRLYANNESVICVNCLVCIEGPHCLSNQLTLYNITRFPDLLSIDIDGCDYYLWKEVAKGGFSPRVVVIEFNPTVPNHVYFVQEENINIQQGSSLLALQSLGKELGYTLVATTVFNGIFLRNDLMGFMPPSVDRDPDICSLH
eukprot:gene28237-37248_t